MSNEDLAAILDAKRQEFLTAFQHYIQSGAPNDEVDDQIESTLGAMRALVEFCS